MGCVPHTIVNLTHQQKKTTTEGSIETQEQAQNSKPKSVTHFVDPQENFQKALKSIKMPKRKS